MNSTPLMPSVIRKLFCPAFNVADTAITVGVIIMIIDLFWTGKHRAS